MPAPLSSALSPAYAAAPRQRRKDARPLELLEAALALFVEKGYASTRSEEVARRAGVSKGTLYLYYPSKEELLKAVITHYLSSKIAATTEALLDAQGSMASVLREVLVAWWQQVYTSPACGTFKLVITEVRNFPELAAFYAREVVEPGHALVGMLLQRGIDSGEFRRVDVDSAVHSLLLPMVMLCTHKHSLGACGGPGNQGLVAMKFIADHVDLVLRGLVAVPIKSRATHRRVP